MIRSEKYLFGAAAVGMVVATALIFNVPVSASSTDESELASFSVEAETTPSLQISNMSNIGEREVRVILPSPYQANAPRNFSTAGTH